MGEKMRIFSLSIGTAMSNDMQRSMPGVLMTRAISLRSRMRGKLSCPVLKAGRRERSLLPSYQNCVHWVLDLAFREDDSRVRQGYADENLAVLRHISLNLLRQEHSSRVGIHTKRLKAGWDTTYLQRVLAGVN